MTLPNRTAAANPGFLLETPPGPEHVRIHSLKSERGSVMAAQQPEGIKRTDLQQHDLSVPGHEVVQARVDLGPTAPFVKHTHPGEEIIYVFEGSWSMRSRANRRPRSRPATSCSSRPERSTRSATSATATPPSSPPTSSRRASPSSPWSNEHRPSGKDHPLRGPGQ